ncbi:MAG TPA: methylamine utilization protein [Candidatus Udaeobacter sp.]|jgi:plastocyanin|nr:methylamine utilization protein [Lacipirellulaceae bacterium]
MRSARGLVLLTALVFAGDLLAGSLEIIVKDDKGRAVSDAVAYAAATSPASVASKKQAVVDQRDKQFVPYVTAVQVGTAVIFPNSDNIRHHVYSFSPAKKFELPLYSGVPAQPVVFDKAGFVTLGCNIHDWMIAYVAVVPTPYFQVTRQEGRAVLKDLPAGQYTIQVWHPALKGQPEALAQRVDVGGVTKSLQFTLPLKHDVRAKRAPGLTTGGYR